MPGYAVKFSASHRRAFPFLRAVAACESEVHCTICSSQFSIANGGIRQIKQHVRTQKHSKAMKPSRNRIMTSFLPAIETSKLVEMASSLSKMETSKEEKVAKRGVRFNLALQKDFPFLKKVADKESEVFCTLCVSQFSIAGKGRSSITQHLETRKHSKSTETTGSNQPMMTSFCSTVDFQAEDHVYNCRFCFRPFTDQRKSIEITETIELKFFELTQFQLVQGEAFSSVICISCENELDGFIKYRHNMLEKQKQLNEAVLCQGTTEVKTEFDSVIIKTEMPDDNVVIEEEFIDCAAFDPDEVKQEYPKMKKKKKIRGSYKKKEHLAIDDADQQEQLDEIRTLMRKAKGTRIKCPACSKSLHKQSLKEHYFTVHLRRRKFKCDFCSRAFYRNNMLLHHMEKFHEMEPGVKATIKPKKACELCGAMVRDERRHILKVHLQIKNFFCDFCPFGAYFKSDLETHLKWHIKKLRPDKLVCDMCGLEFEKRVLIKSHMKAEHTLKERIHKCPECDKTFFTMKSLREHTQYHGARDRPCEFCGKLFTSKNNLRSHLYYHAEPKFVCDFPDCGKKFYVPKLLRGHVKSHLGQKDSICGVCGKGYYSQSDLNRHTFTAHEKLRFYCQVPGCGSSFSRRGYYKSHALALHTNLGSNDLENLLQDIKVALPAKREK